MKKRSYTLMTYALAILLGVALFLTSERVQRAERMYDDIQEKLTTEREAYHILQTEWTYLNRPDRLEDLAATHLKLTPLKPDATLTSVVNFPEFVQPVETEKSVVTAEIANAYFSLYVQQYYVVGRAGANGSITQSCLSIGKCYT